MLPPPIDRIEDLRNRDDFAGLDFVFVSANQRTLFVFFHPNKTKNAQQILGAIQAAQITIFSPSGGESLREVPLVAAPPPAWRTRAGRRVLQVVTTVPGDFSRYRFRLDHPLVDPYFSEVPFSFKANCPSELDCEPLPHECPDEALVDYPVNYTARDFWSIRQALLDFAADRHPAWKDRLEADLGMMLVEVMSALGDEAAYYQDRVAREAYFDTATQRRSLRRHARLVDYQMHDGKGGSTWLDFTVNAIDAINAGTPVWIRPPAVAGETVAQRRGRSASVYEVGPGLTQGPPNYRVDPDVNAMPAYQWDKSVACLLVGSTSMHVGGHHAAALQLDDFTNPDVPGKFAVLRTNPNDAAVPARAWLVRIVRVTDEVDPLTAANITRLEWEAAQATLFEMELESLVVRGNVVPATAGETLEAQFDIEPVPPAPPAPFPPPPAHLPAANALYDGNFSSYAVERSSMLFTLPGSEQRALVWHGRDARTAAPEVQLFEGVNSWEWRRALLGIVSAEPGEKVFTLDDGAWRRVASYRRVDETGQPQEMIHYDYAGGSGTTIRFGNGDFGEVPVRGTSFRAVYRLGRGRGDDVAADSLDDFDAALASVDAVTNPFGVTDALAPESASEVRQVAPDAFRAETFRAVRAEDYAAAVEKLPWVQRAGAQFRWTGSWLTLFATPDPKGSFAISPDERRDLERQLDRYRQAGREAYGLDPNFANIDLEIRVCVAPTAFSGDVKEAVLEALFGRRGVRAHPGFFSPDNWTFGTSLRRAALEAAIQSVPGVKAVEQILIRRRGWFDRRLFEELVYPVAAGEIVRVENDPNLPERGAVKLVMEGGA
jgi:hypothetical protein